MASPTTYVGQTYPYWDIPLNTDVGPDDLTGVTLNTDGTIANMTMWFRPANALPTSTDTQGTGKFYLKGAVTYPAEVVYRPSTTDVSAAFSGSIVIKCLFPPSNSTADQAIYDPIPFTITAA